MKDDPVGSLAHNLKTSGFRVRACFDTDGTIGAAKRIVAGSGKADGNEYGEAFVDRIWESLKPLNQNRKLKTRIANREAGDQLYRDLFFGPVATLTGRIRGAVGFSQARNTPFQGLAADGAKLALWGLCVAGFRCVAFVHDEVVVELGIGSIASYAKAGQWFDFYEIDPVVVRLAQDRRHFNYLSSCQAEHRVILGDARIQLGKVDSTMADAYRHRFVCSAEIRPPLINSLIPTVGNRSNRHSGLNCGLTKTPTSLTF